MTEIKLPTMGKESMVCYTVAHDDLIDFAHEIIRQTKDETNAELMNQPTSEEYYTRKEVMALLKRCDSTMTKWARAGYLVPVRIGGKHLYRKSDVERLIDR